MSCENLDTCLEAFFQYILTSESPYYDTIEEKEEKLKEKLESLYKCFDRDYPNLYETLGIEIYTRPSDGKTDCEYLSSDGQCVYLPNNQRIQASFETYLRENYPPRTPTKSDEFNMKMNLYRLLLRDRFRKIYGTYILKKTNKNTKHVHFNSFGKFVRLYKKLGFTKEKAIKKYNLFHFGSSNIK